MEKPQISHWIWNPHSRLWRSLLGPSFIEVECTKHLFSMNVGVLECCHFELDRPLWRGLLPFSGKGFPDKSIKGSVMWSSTPVYSTLPASLILGESGSWWEGECRVPIHASARVPASWGQDTVQGGTHKGHRRDHKAHPKPANSCRQEILSQ